MRNPSSYQDRRVVITGWPVQQINDLLLAFLGSPAAVYVDGANLNIDAGFNAALTTGQVDFSSLA